MKESFIKKYKPNDLSCFNLEISNAIKTFLELDNLNLLFSGPSGSGKTTIITVILQEYYCTSYANNNILFIIEFINKSK